MPSHQDVPRCEAMRRPDAEGCIVHPFSNVHVCEIRLPHDPGERHFCLCGERWIDAQTSETLNVTG